MGIANDGGVALDSVRGPLADTRVVCEGATRNDRQEEAAGAFFATSDKQSIHECRSCLAPCGRAIVGW
ncbi:MAG: hypothetical protein ACUZ8I_13170 [Candidatus Scalindua sp.]